MVTCRRPSALQAPPSRPLRDPAPGPTRPALIGSAAGGAWRARPRSTPRHLRMRCLPSPRPPAFPRWPPMAGWQRASPRPSRRVPEAEAGRLPSCRHLAAAEAGGGGGRQGPARPPVSSGAGGGERRHGQGTGRGRHGQPRGQPQRHPQARSWGPRARSALPAAVAAPRAGPLPGRSRARSAPPRAARLLRFIFFVLPWGFYSVPLFGCFGYGGVVPGVAARCPFLGQLRARRFWARRLPSRDEGTRASCRAAFPRYLHPYVKEACARGVTLQQLS